MNVSSEKFLEKLRKYSTAKQYLFNVSKKSAMHNLQKVDLRWNK